MTATVDQTRVEQFMGQVITDAAAAISGVTVAIGDRLGLYEAMAGAGPLTSPELAARTGLVERYVREWLACQVAGGYVEHDAATRTYTLPDEHAALSLGRPSGPSCSRVGGVGRESCEALPDRFGAVGEHLLLVLVDRIGEMPGSSGDRGQARAQQVGVAQGGVRAVASGRGGGVDGVTEQRDRSGRPAFAGLDHADGEQGAVVRIALLDQRPQVRVPAVDPGQDRVLRCHVVEQSVRGGRIIAQRT